MKNKMRRWKKVLYNFNSPFASTEWSIVYNQQTGEILYYHRENYDTGYSFQLDKK